MTSSLQVSDPTIVALNADLKTPKSNVEGLDIQINGKRKSFGIVSSNCHAIKQKTLLF